MSESDPDALGATSADVEEAKSHLSRLLDRVAAGEDLILTEAGRPVARLVRFNRPGEPRRPGVWKGRVTIAPDFDGPVSGFGDKHEAHAPSWTWPSPQG